jgi:hypothetical protein
VCGGALHRVGGGNYRVEKNKCVRDQTTDLMMIQILPLFLSTPCARDLQKMADDDSDNTVAAAAAAPAPQTRARLVGTEKPDDLGSNSIQLKQVNPLSFLNSSRMQPMDHPSPRLRFCLSFRSLK